MDGLSGTASVVAILQLAGNVRKLHHFFKSIRDAPRHVQSLLAELHALLAILSHAAAEVQYSPYESTIMDLVQSCSSEATAMLYRLEPLGESLASGNTTRRKWTAIKAVFQREKLENFTKSLERLKSSLILAQPFQQRYI